MVIFHTREQRILWSGRCYGSHMSRSRLITRPFHWTVAFEWYHIMSCSSTKTIANRMSAQFGLIGFSRKEEGNAEQDMKEIIRKSSLLSEGNAEQNIKEVGQDSKRWLPACISQGFCLWILRCRFLFTLPSTLRSSVCSALMLYYFVWSSLMLFYSICSFRLSSCSFALLNSTVLHKFL